MLLSKEDLQEGHYSWNSNEETSSFSGDPSRRSFDRFNGDQVLFLINFYGAQDETFTKIEAQAMEHRILNELPLEAKSEISVYNWLRCSVPAQDLK